MSFCGATVWIAAALTERLRGLAAEHAPLETGGVFAGYWLRDGATAVVTDAVGPGPNACHETTAFTPDAEYHTRELARIYQQSGRLHGYLGDWHTHPFGSTRLSRADRRTLRTIMRYAPARTITPLMGVVAGDGSAWHLGLWIGRERRWLPCGTRIDEVTVREY